MSSEKKILIIDLYLTADPGKSFFALILKYLNHLGWDSTIVTLPPRSLSRGESRWKAAAQDPVTEDIGPTSGMKPASGVWCGIKIVQVPLPPRMRSELEGWAYHQRSKFSGKVRTLRQAGGKQKLRAMLFALGGLALSPFTAIKGPRGSLSAYSEHIWKSMLALHNQEQFCAVVSIYGTFLSHDLGRRFKTQADVPWIALSKDFYSRPDFAGSKGREIPGLLHRFFNEYKRRHEERVLSHSTIVVPYTEVLAQHLSTITSGVPIEVISNCYDPEDYINPVGPATDHNNEDFVISCVGSLADYNLNPFFQALREINGTSDCPDLRARFVGAELDMLKAAAEAYGCSRMVDILPEVSHQEAVRQMRQAACLLSPQVPWELPRRTPEYIGARKPILALPDCPTAVSQGILQQYGGAVFASSKEEIKETLLKWYWEFKATGEIAVQVNEELVRSFSAENRAKEWNQLLEGTLARSNQGREKIVNRQNGDPG